MHMAFANREAPYPARCPHGYKNTYTFMKKVIPRSCRGFLRASALINPVPRQPQLMELKPHSHLCFEWPADCGSDIRTALPEGNRLRQSQIHSELRSLPPKEIRACGLSPNACKYVFVVHIPSQSKNYVYGFVGLSFRDRPDQGERQACTQIPESVILLHLGQINTAVWTTKDGIMSLQLLGFLDGAESVPPLRMPCSGHLYYKKREITGTERVKESRKYIAAI